jgi:hypothetical protein
MLKTIAINLPLTKGMGFFANRKPTLFVVYFLDRITQHSTSKNTMSVCMQYLITN